MPYQALEIGEYFLSLADEDSGDTISNLKLQKLLYYAQGMHLAMHEKPLFNDRIQAWEHGPVVPNVYHEYKTHGAAAIPKPVGVCSSLNPETQKFLDEVWNVFGQFSAWKLRNMTHVEKPWNEVDAGGVIRRDSMREFFKKYLK